MRLYELTPPAPLKDKQKQKLNNVVYTWNDQSQQWLDPRGVKAGGGAHLELMKAVGRNPDGTPYSPGVFAKAKAAFDKAIGGSLGGAIDPKASMLGKAMGRVGAALGRGAAALVRPKGQSAQDADGDGQPDAQTAQSAPAKPAIDQNVDKIIGDMRKLQPAGAKPLPAKTTIDPSTRKPVRVPTSTLEKEIIADLDKVSTNKDYLVRVGNLILKADKLGYDVKDLHSQFMGQVAKGTKQKILQDLFSEELEELKKLAGI